MKVKISFCIFFNLSTYLENTQAEHLSVYRAYGEFRVIGVHKISSEYDLCVVRTIEKTQRETKLRIA